MAARLAPQDVRRVHQSLHHFVANAPWSDEGLLETVRHWVLPAMKRNGPVVAWIVDDTGFPKKGTHSVGVVRQYCGQVGKQENCRIAVSLSLATEQASLPIAWRLYLPETWVQDHKRRRETGIPREITFATKPSIALAANSEGAEGRSHKGTRFGRCRLWQRQPVSRRSYGTGFGVRGRCSEIHDCLDGWKRSAAREAVEREGTPAEIAAPRQRTSTDFPETTGGVFATHLLETGFLAGGDQTETSFPLCGAACSCGSSGLLAKRTPCGRMVADRMAYRGEGTDKVLARHRCRPIPSSRRW